MTLGLTISFGYDNKSTIHKEKNDKWDFMKI